MTDEFQPEQAGSGRLVEEMRGTVEALGYLKLFAQSAGGESTMPQIAALAEDTITRLNGAGEELARDLPSLATSPEYKHYDEATIDALALVRSHVNRVRDSRGFETFVADMDRIVNSLKLAHQVLTGFLGGKQSKRQLGT